MITSLLIIIIQLTNNSTDTQYYTVLPSYDTSTFTDFHKATNLLSDLPTMLKHMSSYLLLNAS